MTYLANCGSVPCSQYNPMPAEWFLIDRQGQYPNGTWVQASISTYLKPCSFPFFLIRPMNISDWGFGDCDYSFQSRSRQLHGPPRDHRPTTCRLSRRCRILSIMFANSSRRLANWQAPTERPRDIPRWIHRHRTRDL